MSLSPSRRLRTAAVITALMAGVALLAAPPVATAAPSGAVGAPSAAEPSRSASGFLFYVIPDPQPTCVLPLGLNASDDPAIDRLACAFTEFQVTGASGAVTADLYADGATAPFAQGLEAAEDTAEPGTYQVSLEPDETWPAGAVRMVVKDGTGSLGQFVFQHNALRATLDTGAPTAPGAPFTVTGTVEVHSARSTFEGVGTPPSTGVPATMTLQVADRTGTLLHSQPVTAADDGTFSVTVPGEKTAAVTAGADTDYRTTLAVRVIDASWTDEATPSTGAWAARDAASGGHVIAVPATNLVVHNSFVSSVGWVKPGETYPSRIIVTNPTTAPITPTVSLTAPTGSRFQGATGPGTNDVSAGDTTATWSPGALASGATATLVLESKAATLGELPTIVWRDLSSTAVVTSAGKPTVTSLSHGPKVIPPSPTYETARYGDRPFPVVPVQYRDRGYQDDHSGTQLEDVINSPDKEGSTFNLFQEMSLGQLFPDGTVPSAGLATADFKESDTYDFSQIQPGQTCTGGATKTGPLPAPGTEGGAGYTERITDGVYNLPGNTAYYGADANGSAIIGSAVGLGALQGIDSGCGPAGKLVYDAAVIADPEIDYSDYDTDKDGVVDFFMAVFAGCGGNGGSQLGSLGCPYPSDAAPYDNIWPHSSSLEYYYTDEETGQAGYVTDDQLKDLEGKPLYYTSAERGEMTTAVTQWKVFVRVGPYNVNPETAIDKASVISHEYGHSLGLPDFYSTGGRETYGDWNLMATDKSQNMDAFSRQELGWVVPEVLPKGATTSVTGWTDSKQDTGTIRWQTADGTPYTLRAGADGLVHNSLMYVAKLPGRAVLDPGTFDSGDKASKSHAWWSGSGNDFGCAPEGARNLDLSIPGLADLPAGTTVTLSMKSLWDIEWDYDYGYVLTTTDGGMTYASNESENGYTTPNAGVPGNVNRNACQAQYDNGLTGSSGSYEAGTQDVDRVLTDYPEPVFLADSYDISELAGQKQGALRFSYATDPGLARPGWFIDDVKVTATTPAGEQVLLETDFETTGGPDDGRIFNGGCREDLTTAQTCTLGWKYLQAGAESEQDHAYYLEMRDRSGFDNDGHGQVDRDPIGFEPGLYLAYTDEAHGYGNAGTPNPPAQSPLDATPDPGNTAPNLNDAAFTTATGRSTFSDAGAGHTDNYSDPENTSTDSRYPDVANPWRFQYDCLGFQVLSMQGADVGPPTSDGDLTGSVNFTMGQGCGQFDYGYTPETGAPANTAPTASATATPTRAGVGQPIDFTAAGSRDTETPNNLDYSWDFGNGGSTKDAAGVDVRHAFSRAGSYDVTVTVTDPMGATDTDTVTVTVAGDAPGNQPPTAVARITPEVPYTSMPVTMTGRDSSDAETGSNRLVYEWSFGDGGKQVDAVGKKVRTSFKTPGYRTIALTVTDAGGKSSTVRKRILVRHEVACNVSRVDRPGSWRTVRDGRVRGGSYCDNAGRGGGRDVMSLRFRGPQVDVWFGRATRGGTAKVIIDGKRVGTLSFSGSTTRPTLTAHRIFTGLGQGRHHVRLVVLKGRAYVEGFGIIG